MPSTVPTIEANLGMQAPIQSWGPLVPRRLAQISWNGTTGPSMMRPGEFSRRNAMKKMLVLVGTLLAAFTMIVPLRAQQAPPLEELKKSAIAEVDKLQTFTQQMVDQMYSYSELGFQGFETSRYVSGSL